MIRKAQASVDAVVATNPVGVGDEEDESSEEEDVEASAGSSLLSPEEQKTNARNDPRSFDAELQSILEEERVTPMGKLLSLVTLFVIVLVINILKGGGSFSPIGIKCGSPGFWTANFSMIFFIVLFAHYVRQYLVKRYEVKERVNYLYVEGDIKWSARNTVVYPAICAFAGFFAGLFGVGGGIVKGPLMLAMNVHPAVSASCSATMILFTSFTATTSFVVFGLLVQDYAVVCVVVGFVSTYVRASEADAKKSPNNRLRQTELRWKPWGENPPPPPPRPARRARLRARARLHTRARVHVGAPDERFHSARFARRSASSP
jgi:hypothetical protein